MNASTLTWLGLDTAQLHEFKEERDAKLSLALDELVAAIRGVMRTTSNPMDAAKLLSGMAIEIVWAHLKNPHTRNSKYTHLRNLASAAVAPPPAKPSLLEKPTLPAEPSLPAKPSLKAKPNRSLRRGAQPISSTHTDKRKLPPVGSDEEGVQGNKRVASKVIHTGKAKDPKAQMSEWGQLMSDIDTVKETLHDAHPDTPTPASRRVHGAPAAFRRRRDGAGKNGGASVAKPVE